MPKSIHLYNQNKLNFSMGFSFYLVALSNKEQALSNSKLRTMKLVALGYYIADIMKMGAEISFARHNYIFHYSLMHRCIKKYL